MQVAGSGRRARSRASGAALLRRPGKNSAALFLPPKVRKKEARARENAARSISVGKERHRESWQKLTVGLESNHGCIVRASYRRRP